jgi:hypothetical protein
MFYRWLFTHLIIFFGLCYAKVCSLAKGLLLLLLRRMLILFQSGAKKFTETKRVNKNKLKMRVP